MTHWCFKLDLNTNGLHWWILSNLPLLTYKYPCFNAYHDTFVFRSQYIRQQMIVQLGKITFLYDFTLAVRKIEFFRRNMSVIIPLLYDLTSSFLSLSDVRGLSISRWICVSISRERLLIVSFFCGEFSNTASSNGAGLFLCNRPRSNFVLLLPSKQVSFETTSTFFTNGGSLTTPASVER